VANGTTADLFLVVARDEDGYVAIFAAEADTAGVKAEVLPLLDLTRSYAAVSFRHAGVQRLIVEDPAPLIARIEALALVAVAAEQVGGATQILDDAIEYAKLRVQFGRPIGSFQAIKHRCADLFVQIEGARSAAFFAAAMLQDDDPEAVLAASVAKAWCSEAFTAAAKAAVQIFGGIGFTWEHDCHLYLRRAKTDELLNGTPAEHRHKIAALVGL
jgi:alkylation response protein AidB-like acyl-CoA dehydrogenase